MEVATEKPRSTGLNLFVRGTLPPPRFFPKKVTNSEKTITTKNLSQHKYLLYKRKLQLETQAALKSDDNNSYWDPAAHRPRDVHSSPPVAQSRIPIAASRQENKQSKGSACESRAVYRDHSDWEKEWYSTYHHFTDYNRQRCDASNTSCVNHTYLRKLLTSVPLTPKVVGKHNETHSTSENSHNLGHNGNKSSPDSDSGDSEDPLPAMNHPEEVEDTTQYCQSMLFSDSFIPTIDMPSRTQMEELQHCRGTAHPKVGTCAVFSFQATTDIKPKPRRHTRSSPSLSRLQPVTNETFQQLRNRSSSQLSSRSKSATRTHTISKSQPPASTSSKEMSFEELKSARTRQLQLENNPLLSRESIPARGPCSYWYEMKTPEFHVEARRNVTFLRKNCNW